MPCSPDLMLRLTLLFGVTLAGALSLRRAAAAAQCLWLGAAIVAALALPVAEWLFPRIWFARERADEFSWLWLAGSLVVAAWMLTREGLSAVRRARSVPVADRHLVALCEKMRRALGHPQPLELRLLPSSTHIEVRRLLRPIIYLPADAERLDRRARRSMLMAAFGRLERRPWSELLAGSLCAVYWFHPLAWLTAIYLRHTAACTADDRILNKGYPSRRYAQAVYQTCVRFGVVGLLRRPGRPAQGWFVDRRLLAILDKGRIRRGADWAGGARAAAVASAALLAAVALPRAFEPAQNVRSAWDHSAGCAFTAAEPGEQVLDSDMAALRSRLVRDRVLFANACLDSKIDSSTQQASLVALQRKYSTRVAEGPL